MLKWGSGGVNISSLTGVYMRDIYGLGFRAPLPHSHLSTRKEIEEFGVDILGFRGFRLSKNRGLGREGSAC